MQKKKKKKKILKKKNKKQVKPLGFEPPRGVLQ